MKVKVHILAFHIWLGEQRERFLHFLRKRVWKKTHGWKEKLLSKVGKEVLIKAILQAVPTYVMSVFMLPASLCDELTSMVRSFWWTSGGKERGIAWKN